MEDRDALNRLLALAGPALAEDVALAPEPPALAALRDRRDGWVAFWGALQLLPRERAGGVPGARELDAVLARAFGPLADGHVPFAQDLFGVLFTLREEAVWSFDPETAACEPVAPDLDGWAAAVLAAPEELVGAAFAFDWQERHGALGPGERLVGLVPFVLGGEYDDANLEPRETLLALRERGALARVVAALPDGAEVPWPLPGTREPEAG